MNLALAGLGLLAVAGAAVPLYDRPESKMLNATKAFLATLKSDQLAKAELPFNSEERLNWFYVPHERKGIPFKDLEGPQRNAALDVLRASLSIRGYQKVETIRQLENVLRILEAGKGPTRDPELYYFTVFGGPAEHGTWGLRFEGHHLSFNWTIIRGKIIASSPQFLGSNPGEVRDGAMKGTRVLAAEEDLARSLVKSLSPNQRRESVVSDKAPGDILTNNQRVAAIQEDRGVSFDKLNKTQQGLLLQLISEYAGTQPAELAKMRLEKIRKAGMDHVKFAWMGGLERGEPHYYRVQGETFLIEYDNTQNNANHVHSVWRDFKGDWGHDLLAEHYKEFAHGPAGHTHRDQPHDQ